MFKQIIYIALISLIVASCSPQKRLNRLISNNPELAKTDTVYTTKTFTVAGYKLDTSFAVSQNVNGLSEIIEVYKDYLDSVRRIKLTGQLQTFIVDRQCLKDTFKVSLANKGFCKFWQSKGLFFYQLHQPQKQYSVTVPYYKNNFTVTTKNNWLMFWIGFCIVPLLITILFVIGKIYKPV